MNDGKPFWASKTLWANLIAFGAVLATTFGLDLGLDEETQLALVGGVMAIVNIALRFVTTQPIE